MVTQLHKDKIINKTEVDTTHKIKTKIEVQTTIIEITIEIIIVIIKIEETIIDHKKLIITNQTHILIIFNQNIKLNKSFQNLLKIIFSTKIKKLILIKKLKMNKEKF